MIASHNYRHLSDLGITTVQVKREVLIEVPLNISEVRIVFRPSQCQHPQWLVHQMMIAPPVLFHHKHVLIGSSIVGYADGTHWWQRNRDDSGEWLNNSEASALIETLQVAWLLLLPDSLWIGPSLLKYAPPTFSLNALYELLMLLADCWLFLHLLLQ